MQDSHDAKASTAGGAQGPESVGALLGKVTENLSHLVRDEIQLAQTQMAEKGKAMGVGIGLFVGAGVFGLFGLGWLLTAAMLGLATTLSYWLSALIVAGAVLLIAAILGLVGKATMGKAPSPETGENIKKDVEAMKQGFKS